MRFNNLKTKRTLPALKKFAPKKIGDERPKLLTDEQMMSMHKKHDKPEREERSYIPGFAKTGKMLMKARE